MKKVIYYFTGTGNSMRGAVKIAEILHNTTIISMRCNPEEVPAADADIIGFVFPVHHWTVPQFVQKFVKRLEINTEAYIFAVSMPSIVKGKALPVFGKLLSEKGAGLSYAASVSCVANYVVMYPPFPNTKRKVPKMENRLLKIGNEILNGKKKRYKPVNPLVRHLFPKIMPKHIEHVPTLDRYFHTTEACISCGLCSKVCPCNNITLDAGKLVFHGNCSQCMACISFCPKEALNFPKFTQDRKKYHNPYITPADVVINKRYIK